MPELLQMLLAASFSSKSWAVEEASELPHASVAKCRLLQVMEQLGSLSGRLIQFFGCHEKPSSGDWLQSLRRGKNTTPLRRPVVMSFCCVKHDGNDLGD
jgi:hypothetical protein